MLVAIFGHLNHNANSSLQQIEFYSKVKIPVCLCNLLSRQTSSVFLRFLFSCYIFAFISCAAVINKMRLESDHSELSPEHFFISHIFLSGFDMSLLRFSHRSSAVSIYHWASGSLRSSLTTSFGKYRLGSNLKSLQ